MQLAIHPAYGPLAFRDHSTERVTLTRSTLVSRDRDEVVEIDGTSHPVVDISSDSHPFWTAARTLDSEGRGGKFQRRSGGKA